MRGVLLLISILLLLPSVGHADAPSAREGTLPCTFAAPDEVQPYVSHLSDGDPNTTVTLVRGESLVMRPSSDAAALYFDFYERPGTFTLTCTDAQGAVVSE